MFDQHFGEPSEVKWCEYGFRKIGFFQFSHIEFLDPTKDIFEFETRNFHHHFLSDQFLLVTVVENLRHVCNPNIELIIFVEPDQSSLLILFYIAAILLYINILISEHLFGDIMSLCLIIILLFFFLDEIISHHLIFLIVFIFIFIFFKNHLFFKFIPLF